MPLCVTNAVPACAIIPNHFYITLHLPNGDGRRVGEKDNRDSGASGR